MSMSRFPHCTVQLYCRLAGRECGASTAAAARGVASRGSLRHSPLHRYSPGNHKAKEAPARWSGSHITLGQRGLQN